MIIDGRALAEKKFAQLKTEISLREVAPHLTIVTCAPDIATQQYLDLKKRRAVAIGIHINVIEVPAKITTKELCQTIGTLPMRTDGIVVQLPLPAHIDTESVLATIPQTMDVDGMHYDGISLAPMSPVVRAIADIVATHSVYLKDKHVVIVGNGRLVGAPARVWALQQGACVTVLTKESPAEVASAAIAAADVLILGAGQANLIQPEMVKEGVVIFDAGASEEGGAVRGDADPACASKASLFTPVPGGIGPLTVVYLLQNLIDLSHRQ